MIRETTIQDCNGRENSLQLKLIEELGEEGYVQQLYDFLQGKYHPNNISDNDKPNLTADQAWHVIYCLREHFGILDDRFERCRVCGNIYDSYCGGTTIDCDSEPHMVEGEDYNDTDIEKEWEESEYGNYCEDYRPD